MATVKAYTQTLLDRQQVIARKLGTNIGGIGDVQTRVVNRALLILVAVLVKTLVDKGVITDAELSATLDMARDDAYITEPVNPQQEP